jgi:hypothetical protein
MAAKVAFKSFVEVQRKVCSHETASVHFKNEVHELSFLTSGRTTKEAEE